MKYKATVQVISTAEIKVEADTPSEALDRALAEISKQECVKVKGGVVMQDAIDNFLVTSVKDENGEVAAFDEDGDIIETWSEN